MEYCEAISLSILFLYIIVILSFTYGFLKLKIYFPPKKKQIHSDFKISVLIPFKNEEMNLPILFNNLKKQTLNKDFFEVIFIDDRSTDGSEYILKELIKEEKSFRLILSESEKNGKKHALKTGIKHAKNELIVTTDADCFHREKWLETIYNYYAEHQAKLIIAPVIMNGIGFFGKLQALEFLSLAASAAGAAGINHPIMCNGANLAFSKSVFNEFEDAMNLNEISGDDVFLLHSIKKKYPKDIRYLKSNDAVVYTDSEITLNSFIRQRIRWASKSKSYKDFDTIFVSGIIFLTNLILVSSLISLVLKSDLYLFVISLFLMKIIPDLILLLTAGKFFKQTKILTIIPILSVIYPFYIVFTAITGLFLKNIRWK